MSFTRSIKLALLALLLATPVFGQVRIPGPGGSAPVTTCAGTYSHITTATTGTSNVSIDVVAGDLIILTVSSASGTSSLFTNASDNGGSGGMNNTWHVADTVVSDRPSTQAVIWAIAVQTSNGLTVTPGPVTAEFSYAATFRLSGATLTGTVDDHQSVSGSGASTVNLTTSKDNALLIGVGDASSANNPGTGFTAIGQGANTVRVTGEYQTSLTNTAGTNAVTLSGGSPFRSILGVAFKPC